jgi:hydroxyacylglutathione hydrolase
VDFILRDQPEPPLYFARMKNVNRGGPAVLGRMPEPRRTLYVNEAFGNVPAKLLA